MAALRKELLCIRSNRPILHETMAMAPRRTRRTERMTTMMMTSNLSLAAGLRAWLPSIEGLADRWRRWRLFRRTYAELDALSTRELDDLGISRSMITRLAYEAAYGRNA